MRRAYPIRDSFYASMDLLVLSKGNLWLRRLLVLTFPVSIPALFFVVAALMVLAIAESIVLGFVGMMREMWRK